MGSLVFCACCLTAAFVAKQCSLLPAASRVVSCVQAKSQAEGLVFVAPYDDPYTIAGQGTIGTELLRQLNSADLDGLHAIFVAIGGGGLIAGIAAYVKALRPEVKIIGVEPTGATRHPRITLSSLALTLVCGVSPSFLLRIFPLNWSLSTCPWSFIRLICLISLFLFVGPLHGVTCVALSLRIFLHHYVVDLRICAVQAPMQWRCLWRPAGELPSARWMPSQMGSLLKRWVQHMVDASMDFLPATTWHFQCSRQTTVACKSVHAFCLWRLIQLLHGNDIHQWAASA